MERTDILNKLQTICDDLFEQEITIGEQTNLINDLGCDSLKMLIFINELEANFNINISLAESQSIKTIGDACAIIVKKSS